MDTGLILNTLNKSYPKRFRQIALMVDGIGYVCTVRCGNQKFILKLFRHAYREKGIQALNIMLYLHEKGLPVPSVLLTNDELPYFTLDNACLDSACHDYCMGALFEYIDGVDPFYTLPSDIQQLGTQTAEMHRLMLQYPGPLVYQGEEYFIGSYLKKLQENHYAPRKADFFAQYGLELWDKVKDLPRGFCHGALFSRNMILTPAGVYYMVDYDLASFSFPQYDIATMCDRTDFYSFRADAIQVVDCMLERFYHGYTKVLPLSQEDISAAYHFIAIRHYQLYSEIMTIYGPGSFNEALLDAQASWLANWRKQCKDRGL